MPYYLQASGIPCDHIIGQYDLVMAGWTVLRFTAHDMNYEPSYCIDLIKEIYAQKKEMPSPLSEIIIFADYDTKEAKDNASPKAAYSDVRRKSYTICNSANDFADDKKPLCSPELQSPLFIYLSAA